jgi:hypothetical protein
MSLFWNTLKINNKQGGFYTRGTCLTITLNAECPIQCDYCPLLDGRTERPKFNNCDMSEWQEFIEGYPEWISLIAIAGGEPTLIPWIGDFINWLIGRGHHVILYSNLWKPWMIDGVVKKSFLFYIQATFHHGDKPERFTDAYNRLTKNGYRVEAFELDYEPKILQFTKPKKFLTPEDGMKFKTLHCSPDAPRTKIIYRGAEWLYKDLKC